MRLFKLVCLFISLMFIASLTAGCIRLDAVTSASPSQDNWLTYHRDLSRSGFDPGVSLGGSLHRLWTSDVLDGDIYAEPLVVGEKVLVATEQDSVYSLDTKTGKVLWHVNLGTPVPLADLSCGNIDPSGITGTPVIDSVTGRLYVVARIQPNHHELFVVDINTGDVVLHRTVDPTGSDPAGSATACRSGLI